jgi:outer membrane lipoprotein-sorting protein
MLRRLLLSLAFAALACAPMAATAAALSAEDKAMADSAAAYLQSLGGAQAGFTQTAPDGSVSTGTLYLQRPGKARFAYDPPALMTIVSDGKTVWLWDGRLKTLDRAPLSRTPLNILLAQQVRLDRGVKIGRIDRNSEGFALTAQAAGHESDGRIAIYFATGAGGRVTALKGWNLTDAQGRTTRVRLDDLSPRSGLSPQLFEPPRR